MIQPVVFSQVEYSCPHCAQLLTLLTPGSGPPIGGMAICTSCLCSSVFDWVPIQRDEYFPGTIAVEKRLRVITEEELGRVVPYASQPKLYSASLLCVGDLIAEKLSLYVWQRLGRRRPRQQAEA